MLQGIDHRSHVVLYVDDQASSLSLFQLTFCEEFTIRTTDSAAGALRILEEEQVAVLIADQRMPGMSGISLMELAKKKYPFIIRLIVSAHADSEELIDAINRGAIYRFLQKPWRRDEMREALRSAIDLYYLEGMVNDLRLQQLRNDRLSALGFAAAGIAHDMKTPLTSLTAGVEFVEKRLARFRRGDDPEVAFDGIDQVLSNCRQSAKRLRTLIDSIRTHVQEQPSVSPRVELSQVVESTLRLCRNEILARAQLEVEHLAFPEVDGNPSQLGQVVLNLVNNAVLSIEPGAMERNRIKVVIDEEEGMAAIRISDSGSGIPKQHQNKIFEPFFSTRAEGTGLGLAITREIVSQHGGELRLESDEGRGSTFTLLLPKSL